MDKFRESISTYENFDKGILEESIKYKSLDVPIKGICELDLIDPLTNKVKERVRTENCISNRISSLLYLDYFYNGILNGTKTSLYNIFYNDIPDSWINLLDWDLAENGDIKYVDANRLGHAYAWSTYAVSDSFRGTLNNIETTLVGNKKHFVFDFPTSAANGTIKSISWSGGTKDINYYNYMTVGEDIFIKNGPVSDALGCAWPYISGMYEYNNKVYLCAPTNNNGYNLSGKQIIVADDLKFSNYYVVNVQGVSSYITNMCGVGDKLYIVSGNSENKIYSVNIPDLTQGANPPVSLVCPIPTEVLVGSFYNIKILVMGEFIYFGATKYTAANDPNNGVYIYKYNLSTMTKVSSIKITTQLTGQIGIWGFDVVNNNIYITCANGNIYRVNLDLNNSIIFMTYTVGLYLGNGLNFTFFKLREDFSGIGVRYLNTSFFVLSKYVIAPPFAYTLLPTPIVKDNAHMLKVKYDFIVDYIEPFGLNI